MHELQTILDERNIRISLRIFDEGDFAYGFESKMILDNQDIFDCFFEKYKFKSISTIFEYVLYFFAQKIRAMVCIVPNLKHEEHKNIIAKLCNEAEAVYNQINIGDIVKFINSKYEEIFTYKSIFRDIEWVTLDFMCKNITGINDSVLQFLCKNYDYLIIDRYSQFGKRIEKSISLFETLFPTGELNKINESRLGKILNIWKYIELGKNTDLKHIVEERVSTLDKDIVALSETEDIENAFQTISVVNLFYNFLRDTKNKMANKYGDIINRLNELVDKSIETNGKEFKIDLPVNEFIKRISEGKSWKIRLLLITHEPQKDNETYYFKSILDTVRNNSKFLFDFVGTLKPTDDFFKNSHQMMLDSLSSLGLRIMLSIMSNDELFSNYCENICAAIGYITSITQNESEYLGDDVCLLINMLVKLRNKDDSEYIYGTAMFLCALSEKLLRLYYCFLVRDTVYIDSNSITLGKLLDSENKMGQIFNGEHLKNLGYFFHQVGLKKIGLNIRNRLAHLSDIQESDLNINLVAKLLWLFTDILNTIFYDALKRGELI